VGKVLTYTETRLGVNTIDLGRSVRDNVTVYGINGSSVIPTGTVSFQVKNGTGPWVIYDANVPLVNRTAISSWYTPTNAAGDFKFQALYDGDWNYNASHSCPWSEPLNVLVAPSGSAVSLIVVGQSATVGITVTGWGQVSHTHWDRELPGEVRRWRMGLHRTGRDPGGWTRHLFPVHPARRWQLRHPGHL
jgi:hypothetical protein